MFMTSGLMVTFFEMKTVKIISGKFMNPNENFLLILYVTRVTGCLGSHHLVALLKNVSQTKV